MNPKRLSLLTAAILLGAVKLIAAEALPDISTGWKFKVGDNRSWSDRALDDSDWLAIRPGIS